jgi:Leucine-rich repeat (LRR) protein
MVGVRDQRLDESRNRKDKNAESPFGHLDGKEIKSSIEAMTALSAKAAKHTLDKMGLAANTLVYFEDKPNTATDGAKLKKHVDDLGSADYQTRTKAKKALEEAGPAALPHLKDAVRSKDAEVRRSANHLADGFYRGYRDQPAFRDAVKDWKDQLPNHHLETFSRMTRLADVDKKTAESHVKTIDDLSKLFRDPRKVELLLKRKADYADWQGRPATLADLGKAVGHLDASSSATDNDVAAISHTPNLTALNLSGSKVTNAAFEHIRNAKKLDSLSMDNTAITDEGLKAVKDMTSMQRLGFAGTKITDTGMNHIKDLTELTILDASRTKITDQALGALKKMEELEVVNLSGTNLTDNGMKQLSEVKSIESLRLSDTKIGDKGVAELANLNNLRRLFLINNTNVTDASIPEFKKMKNLRFLELTGTKVTKEGLDELRKSFPKASIYPK